MAIDERGTGRTTRQLERLQKRCVADRRTGIFVVPNSALVTYCLELPIWKDWDRVGRRRFSHKETRTVIQVEAPRTHLVRHPRETGSGALFEYDHSWIPDSPVRYPWVPSHKLVVDGERVISCGEFCDGDHPVVCGTECRAALRNPQRRKARDFPEQLEAEETLLQWTLFLTSLHGGRLADARQEHARALTGFSHWSAKAIGTGTGRPVYETAGSDSEFGGAFEQYLQCKPIGKPIFVSTEFGLTFEAPVTLAFQVKRGSAPVFDPNTTLALKRLADQVASGGQDTPAALERCRERIQLELALLSWCERGISMLAQLGPRFGKTQTDMKWSDAVAAQREMFDRIDRDMSRALLGANRQRHRP